MEYTDPVEEIDVPRQTASTGEAETEALGERLGAALRPDGVVLLTGDLGAGKTVLARGLARAVGVSAVAVQSPTYTLIHEHEGAAGRLVHVDLYRLEPDEVESLGLEELLAGPGVKAIEWPDRLPFPVPGAWRVEIRRVADGRREIHVEPGRTA